MSGFFSKKPGSLLAYSENLTILTILTPFLHTYREF